MHLNAGELGITVKQWCNLCNSAEAAGTLTVEDPLTKEHVELQSCQPCVDKLDMPEQLEFQW